MAEAMWNSTAVVVELYLNVPMRAENKDSNISNFRRVLNVVCFLLSDSRRLKFICQRFETLSHLHMLVDMKNIYPPMRMSVPKRWHINFRLR
jgi:hypothetical protein